MPGEKAIEQELQYDIKTLKYIRFFMQEELHALAEENDITIDETNMVKGQLRVIMFKSQKKLSFAVKKIDKFVESVKKSLKMETIDVRKIKETEVANKDNIKQLGQYHNVLVGYIDKKSDKLYITGLPEAIQVGLYEIKQILGLPTPSLKTPGNTLVTQTGRAKSTADKHRKGDKPPSVPNAVCFTHVQTGVNVYTAVTDITQMGVDVIVNAANSRLKHSGGVALAIAKAGGPALVAECRQHIRSNGGLAVADTCITTAGHMPAKQVIHTVGPQWRKTSPDQCVDLLHDTFTSVLHTAGKHKCTSIAIPAISSGAYGMPSHAVCDIAVRSVTEYLHKKPKTSLRHIFLVGVDSIQVGEMRSRLDQEVHAGLYTCDTIPTHTTAGQGAVGGAAISPPVTEHRPRHRSHRIIRSNGNGYHTQQDIHSGSKTTIHNGTNGDVSPVLSSYHTNGAYAAQVLPGDKNDDSDPEDEEDQCCICLDTPVNPKTLPKCKHTFCTDCIDRGFKLKPACPVCGEIYGDVIGDQPQDGQMDVSKDRSNQLPGYEGCGVIVIKYSFLDGTQTADMHAPGQPYSGTHRTAYLPDNAEGNKVLKLLTKAFKSRLIFTVGRSRTTGADNTVTWNDIHHKTRMTGGAQMFGYPDPTYLDRVQDELAAKGIK